MKRDFSLFSMASMAWSETLAPIISWRLKDAEKYLSRGAIEGTTPMDLYGKSCFLEEGIG